MDWAGSIPNKDKCLWVAFKGMDGKLDKGTVNIIREELQEKRF